jgi:hypothetical protein
MEVLATGDGARFTAATAASPEFRFEVVDVAAGEVAGLAAAAGGAIAGGATALDAVAAVVDVLGTAVHRLPLMLVIENPAGRFDIMTNERIVENEQNKNQSYQTSRKEHIGAQAH